MVQLSFYNSIQYNHRNRTREIMEIVWVMVLCSQAHRVFVFERSIIECAADHDTFHAIFFQRQQLANIVQRGDAAGGDDRESSLRGRF